MTIERFKKGVIDMRFAAALYIEILFWTMVTTTNAAQGDNHGAEGATTSCNPCDHGQMIDNPAGFAPK
jgi:hypothetical protein